MRSEARANPLEKRVGADEHREVIVGLVELGASRRMAARGTVRKLLAIRNHREEPFYLARRVEKLRHGRLS